MSFVEDQSWCEVAVLITEVKLDNKYNSHTRGDDGCSSMLSHLQHPKYDVGAPPLVIT